MPSPMMTSLPRPPLRVSLPLPPIIQLSSVQCQPIDGPHRWICQNGVVVARTDHAFNAHPGQRGGYIDGDSRVLLGRKLTVTVGAAAWSLKSTRSKPSPLASLPVIRRRAAHHFVRATAHGGGRIPGRRMSSPFRPAEIPGRRRRRSCRRRLAPQQVAAGVTVDVVVTVAAVGKGIRVALTEDDVVARPPESLSMPMPPWMMSLPSPPMIWSSRRRGGAGFAADVVVTGAAIDQVATSPP